MTALAVYHYYSVPPDGYARFLFSLDPNVGSGWTLGGIAFYAFDQPVPSLGTVPVYQYHVVESTGYWRFLYSTNPSIADGWTLDGVVFHALP